MTHHDIAIWRNISPSIRQAICIELNGHLTVQSLEAALAPIDAALKEQKSSLRLVVNCSRMTGYDAAARALFVDWCRTHRHRLDRLAVVTTNHLWHMVVRAMSFASGMTMRAFDDSRAAESWLAER